MTVSCIHVPSFWGIQSRLYGYLMASKLCCEWIWGREELRDDGSVSNQGHGTLHWGVQSDRTDVKQVFFCGKSHWGHVTLHSSKYTFCGLCFSTTVTDAFSTWSPYGPASSPMPTLNIHAVTLPADSRESSRAPRFCSTLSTGPS